MSDDRELTGAEAIAALGEAVRRTTDPAVPTPAELIAFVQELQDEGFNGPHASRMFSALLRGLERQQHEHDETNATRIGEPDVPGSLQHAATDPKG